MARVLQHDVLTAGRSGADVGESGEVVEALEGQIETLGTLEDVPDEVTGTGAHPVEVPVGLDRAIRDLRQQHKFFDEAKFGQIRSDNTRFYFDLVEMVAEADVRVGASVYDSRTSFAGPEATWAKQARMATRLVVANVNKGELVNVFLDLVSTPKGKGKTLCLKGAFRRESTSGQQSRCCLLRLGFTFHRPASGRRSGGRRHRL